MHHAPRKPLTILQLELPYPRRGASGLCTRMELSVLWRLFIRGLALSQFLNGALIL